MVFINLNFFNFQGLLFSTKESIKTPVDLVRLWNHECNRVYRDKFLDKNDTDLFDKIQADFNMKMFDVRLHFNFILSFL